MPPAYSSLPPTPVGTDLPKGTTCSAALRALGEPVYLAVLKLAKPFRSLLAAAESCNGSCL